MTLICANCTQDAKFSITDPGVSPLDYCESCLPFPYRQAAGQGSLPLRVVNDPVPQPEVAEKKTKK